MKALWQLSFHPIQQESLSPVVELQRGIQVILALHIMALHINPWDSSSFFRYVNALYEQNKGAKFQRKIQRATKDGEASPLFTWKVLNGPSRWLWPGVSRENIRGARLTLEGMALQSEATNHFVGLNIYCRYDDPLFFLLVKCVEFQVVTAEVVREWQGRTNEMSAREAYPRWRCIRTRLITAMMERKSVVLQH